MSHWFCALFCHARFYYSSDLEITAIVRILLPHCWQNQSDLCCAVEIILGCFSCEGWLRCRNDNLPCFWYFHSFVSLVQEWTALANTYEQEKCRSLLYCIVLYLDGIPLVTNTAPHQFAIEKMSIWNECKNRVHFLNNILANKECLIVPWKKEIINTPALTQASGGKLPIEIHSSARILHLPRSESARECNQYSNKKRSNINRNNRWRQLMNWLV